MARRARSADDAGFTLLEVMVALGIFLIVVTAILPQMIAGIRSVAKADHEGVVQGLLQQEVERLRGLPFRVSLGTDGSGTDDDVDLLDLYYPNIASTAPTSITCTSGSGLTLPSSGSWKGYVVAGSAARCSYEPAAGAFYRTVTVDTNSRLGQVALIRDLQFLTAGTATATTPSAIAPRAGYDSDHAITNYPPSSQVAVTLTVLYKDRGAVASRSLYTQIAKHDQGPTLVTTRVDSTAIQISSLAPGGAAESLEAGVVGLEASVGDISTAGANLAGVVARVTTGDTTTSQLQYGASKTVAAPPSGAIATVPGTPNWGPGACSTLLCFGASQVGPDGAYGIVTDGGLPTIGDNGSPVRAAITGSGSGALSFDNVGSMTAAKAWQGPIVQLVGEAPGASTITAPPACVEGTGAAAPLSGAGYLTTSPHPGAQTQRDTAACASARSATIAVLPTSWAPDGIVRITLNRSFAWCTVTGGTPTGGTGLSATVQVYNGPSTYTTAPDMAHLNLATPIPGHGTLGDWLTGWQVETPPVDTSGSKVTATVPGIRVTTIPTRLKGDGTPDEDSAIVITVGATSCSSETSS